MDYIYGRRILNRPTHNGKNLLAVQSTYVKRASNFKSEMNNYFKSSSPCTTYANQGICGTRHYDTTIVFDLNMVPMYSDTYFYFNRSKEGRLYGLSGTQVDEIIRRRDKAFKTQSKGTHYCFNMDTDEHRPCIFTGFCLSRDTHKRLIMYQHSYLFKIKSYQEMKHSATSVLLSWNFNGYLTLDKAYFVPFRLFPKSLRRILTPI